MPFINTLPHIFYLLIIFFQSIFSVLIASEKFRITDLPIEIRTLIFENAFFKHQNTYFIHYCKNNNVRERIHIPCTFIPTKLTQAWYSDAQKELEFYTNYSFDMQLATTVDKKNMLRVRLCDHAHKRQNISVIFGTSRLNFFDGINKNGMAVAGRNELGKYFYIYAFALHYHTRNIQSRVRFKSPIQIEDNLQQESIKSLMLHPEKDTIVFTTTRQEKDPFYKNFPHRLTIGNISKKCLSEAASINLPFLIDIQKVIYLGYKTYLALTYHHRLVILWQEEDGTINYCKQKHSSNFIDIAVDNTVENARGFKPHIACLTTHHELFVCSLLAFAQPILFFIKKIPHPLKNNNTYFFRLFYDKGQCAIIYKDMNTADYDNIVLFPDNLPLFILKKSMELAIEKNIKINKKE